MRISAAFVFALALAAACKTTRENHRSQESNLTENPATETIENEDQLPGCDDITIGRVYWVRSLNMQMVCAEGGTWSPRQVDPDAKADPTFGPRGIH